MRKESAAMTSARCERGVFAVRRHQLLPRGYRRTDVGKLLRQRVDPSGEVLDLGLQLPDQLSHQFVPLMR